MVSTIDFRYITDAITPAESIQILKDGQANKQQRIDELLSVGYPCYTTQVGKLLKDLKFLNEKKKLKKPALSCESNFIVEIGWLGYTDEYRRKLCKEYMAQGFNAFKLKVGQNLEDDRHRCRLIREEIGWDNKMVGGNILQFWKTNNKIKINEQFENL